MTLVLDEKRSPTKLRPLFRQLRIDLFDQGLTLKRILGNVGDGERSVWSSFRGVVGCPAWTYIREARLEAAARLLLFTTLEVAQICHKVGYASRPAFRSAFAGMTPARYRRVARRRLVEAGARPRYLEDQVFWEEALTGQVDDETIWELDAYLKRLENAAS